MQDRASDYLRENARTLPRRALAPTQRRIPATTPEAMPEAIPEALPETMPDDALLGAPGPRSRARSAARALTSYGASAIGAPAMIAPAAGSTHGGMGQASVAPGLGTSATPYLPPGVALTPDPEVWLIALATPGGGLRPLEGAGRQGAIRVGRPYGHLRSIRPVLPPATLVAGSSGEFARSPASQMRRRGLGSGVLTVEDSVTAERATSSNQLPAERPKPQIISAVEVETDAGVFRVERPESVLDHSDLAWAMAHLEAGEPDALVPLPRRQLALLLTLLPTPEDPEHPELDPQWGWAHRLKAPWERGPLHARGRLGRLIAVDPDLSSRGMHRACFEMLGTEEVVWALGVPCYRTGSVYELTPRRGGVRASRWLTWPLPKGRSAAGSAERPTWEIARVVYRVGAPRWPLAGIVEPLGPMGVAG
jgi:hypothetical protein